MITEVAQHQNCAATADFSNLTRSSFGISVICLEKLDLVYWLATTYSLPNCTSQNIHVV
ncbi:hypothetical protein D3C86_1340080 [compost metagenome]